jgi:hypothetical protein
MYPLSLQVQDLIDGHIAKAHVAFICEQAALLARIKPDVLAPFLHTVAGINASPEAAFPPDLADVLAGRFDAVDAGHVQALLERRDAFLAAYLGETASILFNDQALASLVKTRPELGAALSKGWRSKGQP